MSSKYRNLAKSQKAVLETDFLNQLGSENVLVVIDNQMDAIMFRFGNQLIEDIRKSIEDKDLDASGELKSKTHPYQSVSSNNHYKLEVKMLDYWEAAETGRRSGKMPPIENIMEWITNKGIKVRQSRSEKTTSVLKRRRSMAYAISRTIGERGTIKRFNYKGSKFLTEVVTDEAIRDLSLAIGELLGKTVAVSFATTFNPKYGKVGR